MVIDCGHRFSTAGIIGFLIGNLLSTAGADEDTVSVIFYVIGFIMGWCYFALMESLRIQATVGKWALRIIVTDLEGRRISFGRATGRYFAKLLSLVILFVGHLMIAFTGKKQGLHDMMAILL